MNTGRYGLTDQFTRSRATACIAEAAKRLFREKPLESLRGKVITVHKFALNGIGKHSLVVELPAHRNEPQKLWLPKNLLALHPGESGLVEIGPATLPAWTTEHSGVLVFSNLVLPGKGAAEKYANLLSEAHGKPFAIQEQGDITLMCPENGGRSVTLIVTKVMERR